jgi:uncharacterized phiE125 gp8 family phage protein
VPSRLITPPASEPITLAEAKAHLRLEVADDDAEVTSAIQAARQWAEQYLWRGIVSQTWELLRDGFPCEDHFELPKGNLGTVSFVKYLTSVGGSLQTLATSAYLIDTATEPGRILLPFGSTWPTTVDQWNSVQVQYTVGWAVADVPEPIKRAMLLLVSQLYEHRTPEVTGTIVSPVQFAVEALLGPYRLARF